MSRYTPALMSPQHTISASLRGLSQGPTWALFGLSLCALAVGCTPKPIPVLAPSVAATPSEGDSARMTWGEVGEAVLNYLSVTEGDLALPPLPSVEMVSFSADQVSPIFEVDTAPTQATVAWAAFKAGQWKQARSGFKVFVAAHKDHPLAPWGHYLLGWLCDRSGRDAESAEHYREAAARLPDPGLAQMARIRGARAALQAKSPELALQLIDGGALGPRFTEDALKLRADALERLGRLDDALDSLDMWLAADPKRTLRVRLDRADLLRRMGRDREAAHAYHVLWRRYPTSDISEAAAGRLRAMKKAMSRKAWAELGPGLTLTGPGATVQEGWRNLKRDYARRIQRDIGRLLRKGKGVMAGDPLWCDGWWLMAEAHKLRRMYSEQEAAWKTFIDGCPADDRQGEARFAFGRALWNQDRDDEALAVFDALWREHPEASEADDALLNTAIIHHRHDRPEASREAAQILVRRYPSGDKISEAHWMLMSDLLSRSQWAEAAHYAAAVQDQQLARAPLTRDRMRYFQIRALELMGRGPLAVEGYRAVVRGEPMGYYALLALNRLKALRPDQFIDDYRALVESSGDGVAALTLPERPWMADPTFSATMSLMRIGLMTEARRGFRWLRRHYHAGDELRLLAAQLFRKAGAEGHADDIMAHEVRSVAGGWPVGPLKAQFSAAFPQPFDDHVEKWTSSRDLSAAFLYAVMRVESGFNPRVVSWAKACGLMQMLVPTAQHIAKDDGIKRWKRISCGSLKRPAMAIRLGSRFLSWLLGKNQDHHALAAAGYHAGQGNVNKWLRRAGHLPFDVWAEQAPFPRTRKYIRRVVTTMWTYQWLRITEGADPPLVHLPMHLDSLATR